MTYKVPQIGDIFKCILEDKHYLILEHVESHDYTCLDLETGEQIVVWFHPYAFNRIQQVG